ncbi:MAG: GNAT family N-acetyltransferase [Planctomycetes bacterium]|nr:GNAT family N-acetyltransferase [Planctomycetota bacterium]
MNELEVVDLDQRPAYAEAALALLSAHPPGRSHVVCGLPVRAGLPPTMDDLRACLGTLVLLWRGNVAGVLALCPYSDEQVTLWGPVVEAPVSMQIAGGLLIDASRPALREGGFESVRALADTRNRALRAFLLAHGFSAWKDDHVYERSLAGVSTAVAGVRAASRKDHRELAELLGDAFPESQHALPSLAAREKEGYRHYVVEDAGLIVAGAAVQQSGRRSWLKLVAVLPGVRGGGIATRLLKGLLAAESARGQRAIGLEVLADNPAAIAAFAAAGFKRSWTVTILTGPV